MFNYEKIKEPVEIHAYQTSITEGISRTDIFETDIKGLWSCIKIIITEAATNFRVENLV